MHFLKNNAIVDGLRDRTWIGHGLLLSILTICTFIPGLDTPPADDASLFLIHFANVHHSMETIFSPSAYPLEYRPFIHFFNYLIHLISGRNFTVYHVVRLLLHCVNVFLVYRFVALFLKAGWRPLFAAAVFAIHPAPAMRVLETAPSSFFVLFTLLTFFAYRGSLRESPWRVPLYLSSIAAFSVCLLLREEMVYLLLVLPLYEWMFQRKDIRKLIVRQVPFWLLAGGYLYMKIAFETAYVEGENMPFGIGWNIPINLLDYLAALFFPHIRALPDSAFFDILRFSSSEYFIVNDPDFWISDALHFGLRIISAGLFLALFAFGTDRSRFCILWVVFSFAVFLPLREECSGVYLDQSSIAFGVVCVPLLEWIGAVAGRVRDRLAKPAVILAALSVLAVYVVQVRRVAMMFDVEGTAELYQTEGRWTRYDLGLIASWEDMARVKGDLVDLYYKDEGCWPKGVYPRHDEFQPGDEIPDCKGGPEAVHSRVTGPEERRQH